MSTRPRDIDASGGTVARRIVLSGRVQGVGFRPFVYRTAVGLGLKGWVRNSHGRVQIHVEGDLCAITRFESALTASAPPLAKPRFEESESADIEGAEGFSIDASDPAEVPDVHLPPDQFCCEDCLAELENPAERRFRYAFTNCTQCGPRYTIIEALPYDRPSTSMAGFELCANCRREYENPLDRRFHAEPLACPDCGPELTFRCAGTDAHGDAALGAAIACLREGGIVAVKGIGGYHLVCDAANDAAVRRLRARKHRPHKPFAVMFAQGGADGLDTLREHVCLGKTEAGAVANAARPIVLVPRRAGSSLSGELAPGLTELGVFLPYSPLHHLLLAGFGGPLVATSGNVSGEPVISDNEEAASRLAPVVDAFLEHDRPIVRPADDSVVRVIGGRVRVLRVGRGIAPLELERDEAFAEPVLAVGGHIKGAIALGWERRAVVSPHIGELDSQRSHRVFARLVADLETLYGVGVRSIVCDLHPRYASTRWAQAQHLPVTRVQHHAAHASALAGEHPEIERWLVFTWDGIGLGDDGDLWGGEALAGAPGAWRRVASLRPFHVTGGDLVGREPWRSAAGICAEMGWRWHPRIEGAELVAQAWEKRIATARTSSVGRLFDAAASLVLGLEVASFEGQGPMMLESAAAPGTDGLTLPLAKDRYGVWRADWAPLVPILRDAGLSIELKAGMFHESLARCIVAQVEAVADTVDPAAIGLTGGVFQNRLLAERAATLLGELGFVVHLPLLVPPNDGGLAFGQLIEKHGLDARGPSRL